MRNEKTSICKHEKKLYKSLFLIFGFTPESPTMSNLPGIRSGNAAVRRSAKIGRTVLRAVRGTAIGAAAMALAIETFCISECCYPGSREKYENLMDTSPEDFMLGLEKLLLGDDDD